MYDLAAIQKMDEKLHRSVFSNSPSLSEVIYESLILLDYLAALLNEENIDFDTKKYRILFRKWKTLLSHHFSFSYRNDIRPPKIGSGTNNKFNIEQYDYEYANRVVSQLRRHPFLAAVLTDSALAALRASAGDADLSAPRRLWCVRLLSQFLLKALCDKILHHNCREAFNCALAAHSIATESLVHISCFIDQIGDTITPVFFLPSEVLEQPYLNHYATLEEDQFLGHGAYFSIVAAPDLMALEKTISHLDSEGRVTQHNKKLQIGLSPQPISVDMQPTLSYFKDRDDAAISLSDSSRWFWQIAAVSPGGRSKPLRLQDDALWPMWRDALFEFSLAQEEARTTGEAIQDIRIALAA